MAGRRRVLFLSAWNVQALHEGVAAYAHEANWFLDNRMCYSGVLPLHVAADGVLCRHSFRKDILDFARTVGVPMVGLEDADGLPLPRVCCHEEAVGRRAARHLLARGFSTLASFHCHGTPVQIPRLDGFRVEAETAGASVVELAPQPGDGSGDSDADWNWLAAALAPLPKPVGVMVISDLLALPLIDALLDFGYQVPEQVAVVSAENDPMLCEMSSVPLSSVDTRTRQLGYEAARLLDSLMDGAPAPETPVLIAPGEVQTRASTDTIAIPNLHAANALRLIWTHYTEPINVDTVSARTTVTRRRLQTLFREHVGRTMQEEIVRVRLADACRRLKETDMKIRDVAAAAGFSSSLHLHRTFQAAFRMGPKAFRERGVVPDFGTLPARIGNIISEV